MTAWRKAGFGRAVLVALWVTAAIRWAWATEQIGVNTILDHDIVVTSGHGLVVTADDITIDGNGHSIIYSGPPSTLAEGWKYGISMAGRARVKLKNFAAIKGFAYGVYAPSGNGNEVSNCKIADNLYYGLAASGIILRNNEFREPNQALSVGDGNATLSIVEDNLIIGGRRESQVRASGGFRRNQFLHQSGVKAITLDPLERIRNSGQRIEFRFLMYGSDGAPAQGYAAHIRTVPPEPVDASPAGNAVSGGFVPARTGLYSLLIEVTDPSKNRYVRAVRLYVGPTAERTVTYYLTHKRLSHGQVFLAVDNDSGAMSLTPPPAIGVTYCNQWVQQSPDELPVTPMALLTAAELKTNLRFYTPPARVGLERNVTWSTMMDKTTPLNDALANPTPTPNIFNWSENTVGDLKWMLDYPYEWYFLAAKLYGSRPSWQSGNPERLSNTVFHYHVTTTPEVLSLTDHSVLLLGASADPTGQTAEQLVVWGAGAAANLTLAAFRRPFLELPTQIRASGEATCSVSNLTGEETLHAVPLDIWPAKNSISAAILEWPTENTQKRRWTESASNDPGTSTHTLSSLTPLAPYRVDVGAAELLTGAADSQGKLTFLYAGPFPVTFSVYPAPANTPPALMSGPSAAPNPAQMGQVVSFSVSATDADGDALTLAWSFGDGGTGSGATPAHSYAAPGSYTASVTVNDGKGGSTSAATIVTVTTAINQTPTIAVAAKATPNPVTGTTASLSVLGADDGGEAALIYTWAATGSPPAAVIFSSNGTNAAKNCTAQFSKAGSYSLQVTLKDSGNSSVSGSLKVVVSQTLTSIVVSPASATVNSGATLQFAAAAKDQFGANLAVQPAFTWQLSGGSRVEGNGLFTASGSYTMSASSGGKVGLASVTVP